LAERMPDETVKQTMLSVAEECDGFAIKAAMCSIYELAVSWPAPGSVDTHSS
jgi:hypothetical protein